MCGTHVHRMYITFRRPSGPPSAHPGRPGQRAGANRVRAVRVSQGPADTHTRVPVSSCRTFSTGGPSESSDVPRALSGAPGPLGSRTSGSRDAQPGAPRVAGRRAPCGARPPADLPARVPGLGRRELAGVGRLPVSPPAAQHAIRVRVAHAVQPESQAGCLPLLSSQ